MFKNGTVFCVFMFCVMFVPANARNTIDNEANVARIRRRRSGIVKTGIKGINWTMRWFRVRQAMNIMLADAKLIKEDKNFDIEWYQKTGGIKRAFEDFWKIGVANKTKAQRRVI